MEIGFSPEQRPYYHPFSDEIMQRAAQVVRDGARGIGRVHMECFDRHGFLKWVHEGLNIYTDAGITGTAERAGGIGGTAAFDWVAVGTSATAAGAGDTMLIAEITTGGLARAQVTPTLSGTDTLRNFKAFSASASFTVAEIGVLNAASAGDLLGRNVLAPTKSVDSGDTLNATYDVQWTR